jgi:hypothetical protein
VVHALETTLGAAMRKAILLGVFVSLSCALLSGHAHAQSTCSGLPIDLNSNFDSVLLYRMGGAPWQPLQTSDLLPSSGSVQFVYVVREFWDSERYGVIVVKSGSSSPRVANPQHPDTVLLSRPRAVQSEPANGTCGTIKTFLPTYVSATSYDRYHDLGINIPKGDSDTLTAYHIHYLGRGGTCRDSDNTDYDSPLRFDLRSNRSQFSFDTYVVSHGMASQFANSVGLGSALAGAAGLSDARAQMRRYHIDSSKIACIPFTLNVGGEGYFLRIDDLDASKQQGFFSRTSEKSWQLTR